MKTFEEILLGVLLFGVFILAEYWDLLTEAKEQATFQEWRKVRVLKKGDQKGRHELER